MLNRITTALLTLELLVIVAAFSFVHWTPIKVAGAIIIVGAMLLLIVARRELGNAFSVRARASHLVTTGVYARIRNPIYLAGILLVAGAALLFESWWVLAILLVLLPIQWRRAHREAAVLHRRFGEQYEAYRRSSWF